MEVDGQNVSGKMYRLQNVIGPNVLGQNISATKVSTAKRIGNRIYRLQSISQVKKLYTRYNSFTKKIHML